MAVTRAAADAPRVPRPLRALLGAHLTGSWHAFQRQSGRVGRVGLIAFGALFVIMAGIPVAGGLGFLGHLHVSVASYQQARIDALVAGVMTTNVVVVGIIMGLTGASRRLPWELLRVFPVATRTLFAADLCASALDLATTLPLLGLAAFCVAASIGNPVAAPLYLVLFASHALMLLSLLKLVGSVLQRASRNLRLTLLLAPVLGALVLSAGGLLMLSMADTTIGNALEVVKRITMLLPARPLLSAASALRHGTLTGGLLLTALLLPLAVTMAMLMLAYVLVSREAPPRAEGTRSGRLWTFTRPTWGIARMQWSLLINSLPGRMVLAFPLLSLVISLAGFARKFGPGGSVVLAFVYSTLSLTGLVGNQLGLDRHGIKLLLLLPIDERAILRGKWLAHALLSVVQALLLAALFAAFRLASGPDIAIGVAAHCCVFLLLSMVGLPFSVWQPRPLSADRTARRAQLPMLALLVLLGAILVGAALVSGVLLATRYWLPGWELPALGALLVALLGLQEPALRFSARLMVRRREQLVEQLASAA